MHDAIGRIVGASKTVRYITTHHDLTQKTIHLRSDRREHQL